MIERESDGNMIDDVNATFPKDDDELESDMLSSPQKDDSPQSSSEPDQKQTEVAIEDRAEVADPTLSKRQKI